MDVYHLLGVVGVFVKCVQGVGPGVVCGGGGEENEVGDGEGEEGGEDEEYALDAVDEGFGSVRPDI